MSAKRNKYFEASRVVFLLGAGASVKLGMPTTVTLREKLCDKTADGNIAAEIHASAAYRFRIPKDAVNVEDFLEHLYELQLLVWLGQRSSLPTLLPGLTGNAASLQMADATLGRLNRRVYELLHQTCGDTSGVKVHRLWRAILDATASRQPLIPIFTLNYDWTFEKLAIEKMNYCHLVDGFDLLGEAGMPAALRMRPRSPTR